MEYDNDRPVRHVHRAVFWLWGVIILGYPLLNGLSVFPQHPAIWPLLLLVNLFLLPVYILYSQLAGPRLFVRKKRLFFIVISVLTFLLLHSVAFALFSILLKFSLPGNSRSHLQFTLANISRESLWMIINMSLALGIYSLRRAVDNDLALDDTRKENAFYKLRYLRSQLSPHFLFNTLNSIYSLSLQKSDRAPEVVVRLAEVMRYLIYECNEERIPLDKEIAFIRNYIEIEKTRYDADIRFTVEGETSGILIEPFLFISFIENGFKHAIDHSLSKPYIYITLKVRGNELALNVINSSRADVGQHMVAWQGKGMLTSKSLLELLYADRYRLDIIQTQKEAGENELRLRHARERLETLYPDAYTLDVLLSKDSFTVSLIIKTLVA